MVAQLVVRTTCRCADVRTPLPLFCPCCHALVHEKSTVPVVMAFLLARSHRPVISINRYDQPNQWAAIISVVTSPQKNRLRHHTWISVCAPQSLVHDTDRAMRIAVFLKIGTMPKYQYQTNWMIKSLFAGWSARQQCLRSGSADQKSIPFLLRYSILIITFEPILLWLYHWYFLESRKYQMVNNILSYQLTWRHVTYGGCQFVPALGSLFKRGLLHTWSIDQWLAWARTISPAWSSALFH